MRDVLAERLLARVMDWKPEDVAEERPILQALGSYKYDEYQQFAPGMRFVESLAQWLAQFETVEERLKAYDFVRSRLIFISNAEMSHLVSMAYFDVIRPLLLTSAAINLGHSPLYVARTLADPEFKLLLRQTLFLGLSDGARIDQFRRSSSDLSNEQVWQTYEITVSKAEDLLKKLERDIKNISLDAGTDHFRILVLIDDFSASGISYIRKENGFSGKIARVLRGLSDRSSPLFLLFGGSPLIVCTLLYVATTRAILHIEKMFRDWQKESGLTIDLHLRPVQTIGDDLIVEPRDDPQLDHLLQTYFDPAIIDEHYEKGRHDRAYLGFDECALPIVLTHNTPNNSIPLLWFDTQKNYRGLFPRASRHRVQP